MACSLFAPKTGVGIPLHKPPFGISSSAEPAKSFLPRGKARGIYRILAPSKVEGYAKSSAKSFIYRFYAKSLANPFIYRIYAKHPGWGS